GWGRSWWTGPPGRAAPTTSRRSSCSASPPEAPVRYVVRKGRVVVTSRAAPDLSATFDKPAGAIDIDPERPAGARAEITLDMRSFTAGDWFADWKVKGECDPERHPVARFLLIPFDDL